MITYVQALILGLLQGVTELFPVSSLGHSVLIPYIFNWHNLLVSQTQRESLFLSFLVVLHIATALALLFFYRYEWERIIKGLARSIKAKKITDPYAKLGWLLIAATIPAGLIGLVFEHSLRSQFAKPFSAIVFITINGFILLAGDRYMRMNRSQQPRNNSLSATNQLVSQKLSLSRSVLIGVAQIGALFAGISRSGITIVSGLYSGLDYETAARFSFLLATPIILAAGLYKLPTIVSPAASGIRGQMLVGAIAAAIGAYYSVKYLDRYFKKRDLRPFAFYSIAVGVLLLLLGIYRGHF